MVIFFSFRFVHKSKERLLSTLHLQTTVNTKTVLNYKKENIGIGQVFLKALLNNSKKCFCKLCRWCAYYKFACTLYKSHYADRVRKNVRKSNIVGQKERKEKERKKKRKKARKQVRNNERVRERERERLKEGERERN